MSAVVNSPKYIQLVLGEMDGATVERSEIKEGVLRKSIKAKTHDYGEWGPGHGQMIWVWTKNKEEADMVVVYKLDGNKLVYSHKEKP